MVGNRDLILDRTKLEHFTLQLNHCGLQSCGPGYSYSFKMNPYHLIHFVLDGSGTLKAGSQEYSIHSGQAFYIPAGTPGWYQASYEHPWKYCWIGVYANSSNPLFSCLFDGKTVIDLSIQLEELEQLFFSIIAVTDQRFQDAAAYLEADYPGEQFFPITGFADSLEANGRAMHLFSRLLKTQPGGHGYLYHGSSPASDARSYIDMHYNQPIKIQDIAAALHIHPNYLSTAFKKVYGQSPSGYLRALRMSQAGMLLHLTDYPVSAVAQTVGYCSAFQFSAAFKSYYEVSPTEYRKRGR